MAWYCLVWQHMIGSAISMVWYGTVACSTTSGSLCSTVPRASVPSQDEDEILGRGSATPSPLRSAGRSWIDELADELEQLPGWSDDDFDDGSGSDADSVDGSAWAAETTDAAAALVPPRAVRSALSFCCAYRLQENLPEPCPICLDDFARGQEAWRLPCTHIFHASCIMSSFGMRRAKITCPLCRCDVKRLAVASPSEISAAVATPGVIG